MLYFNGLKFAKNEREFIDSLFSGQTCSGFYKDRKNEVLLYNLQYELFSAIVKQQTPFIVSACFKDGNYWFVNSLTEIDCIFLGLQNKTYSERLEDCKKCLELI
jgi:hypothetical protein